MISKTLLRQTIRENITLWLVLTGVQGLLLAVLGGTVSSVAMTAMTYYKMLPGILVAVYVIITGNKLLSAQVDNGTMAYVLSTPVKRLAVTVTQAVYFIGSLFLMFAVSAAAHIISAHFSGAGISSTDVGLVLKLNLGMFALSLAYSGICFLASSVFNLSKYTIAVGGGLVGMFLLLPVVSMFSEKFKDLKNLSIASLYDPMAITKGSGDYIWQFAILACIGIVTYVVGSAIFKKRDLPL
jgi:ABC-2 type transport system permease protein